MNKSIKMERRRKEGEWWKKNMKRETWRKKGRMRRR